MKQVTNSLIDKKPRVGLIIGDAWYQENIKACFKQSGLRGGSSSSLTGLGVLAIGHVSAPG